MPPGGRGVSWHQLLNPHFVDQIDETLRRTGLSPSRLVLEITERFVALTDDSVELIGALRRRGIAIGLDDFGQGETSLRQFAAFEQLDLLKLDRELITNAVHAERGRTILEVLVEMVHRLGVKVVAEGVETEDLFRMVRTLGCDIGLRAHS